MSGPINLPETGSHIKIKRGSAHLVKGDAGDISMVPLSNSTVYHADMNVLNSDVGL